MKYGALEDKIIYQEIKNLIDKFNITRVIETGTYLGWSTKVFADLVSMVDTIEVNSEYYKTAKQNLQNFSNVNIHLGDSVVMLDQLINQNETNLLVFLDAHWAEHWPILQELNVLKNKNSKPVICIHDFFVPGGNKIRNAKGDLVDDPESEGSKFGYDIYQNIPLDYEYIKDSLYEIFPEGFSYHYNSEIERVDSGLIFIYPN